MTRDEWIAAYTADDTPDDAMPPEKADRLLEKAREAMPGQGDDAGDWESGPLPEGAPFQRIVGEVRQALAGKPAEECVTDEGRAVAELRYGLFGMAEDAEAAHSCMTNGCVDSSAIDAIEALCAKNGWTP